MGVPTSGIFGPGGHAGAHAQQFGHQNLQNQLNQPFQQQMALQNQLGLAQLVQHQNWQSFLANAPIPAVVHSGRLKKLKNMVNTLGWRGWAVENGKLKSPQQHTLWDGPELRCEKWDEGDVVRGVAGIHALLAPERWRDLVWEYGHADVTGIVERFGKFVLGEDGWRAEWVMIRELCCPTLKMADELSKTYPEVTIHCDED